MSIERIIALALGILLFFVVIWLLLRLFSTA